LECIGGTCTKCEKGLYQYGNSCYDSCPFETLADNVSLQCKWHKEKPVYVKAYTISRCVNSCGKTFHDCSCHPRCKKSGNCCTDFQFCEIVNESYSIENKIENCKFSTEDKSVCLQCKDNFYYHNNSCVRSCPEGTLINKENKICIDRDKSCLISNCEKCDETNNSNKCKQCLNGYFLFEGKCLKTCPVGLRANRINFTCQPKSEYSFYWIFPSKAGCEKKCGEHSIEHDCSCRRTCLRRGNCCDNFEKECRDELQKEKCKLCEDCFGEVCNKCKSNSTLDENKSECKCKEGYQYDLEEDVCHKNSENEKKKFLNENQNKLKQVDSSHDTLSENKNKNSFDDSDDEDKVVIVHPPMAKQIQEINSKVVKPQELNHASKDHNNNNKKVEYQQNHKIDSNPKISNLVKSSQNNSIPKEVKSNIQQISINVNENKFKDDEEEEEEDLPVQLTKSLKQQQNTTIIMGKNIVEKTIIENKLPIKNDKKNNFNQTQVKLQEVKNNLNDTKIELMADSKSKISNKTDKLGILNNESKFQVNQTKIKFDLPKNFTLNSKTSNKVKNITTLQNFTLINDTKQKLKNSILQNLSPTKEKLSPQINHSQSKTNSSLNTTYVNHSPLINQALAEELLKSFKNVFSMPNPVNKNQILNLYMNGNISINVLTGNTNPQMITQNIYNKDSYNQNHQEVSNIDSQNKVIPGGSLNIHDINQSDSELIKTNKPKVSERKGRLLYRRKNSNSNEKSYRQLSVGKLHTDHEKNFEEKTQLKNSLNIKSIGEEKIRNEGNFSNNNGTKIVYNDKLSNSTMNRTLNTVKMQKNNLTNFVDEFLVPSDTAQSFKPSNFDSDFLNSTSYKKEKYNIQNNYYINDHSIKVLHSTNPSVIKLGDSHSLNNSLCNNSSHILINNNQDHVNDSLLLHNKTSGIVINNNSLNITKNK
jgi:hypothetical protein